MDFDIAMLVLRVGIGIIFVAHGLQKLLGWWDGPGWQGWKGFIGYLGLRPPLFWASISLVAELGGGLALIVGLLVPLAAAGLVAQSIALLWKVHRPKGFWSTDGGIEFPLAFMVGAFAVQVLGPGSWSFDSLVSVDVLYEPAVRWTLLGVAVAGALVASFWPTPTAPAAASTAAAADSPASGIATSKCSSSAVLSGRAQSYALIPFRSGPMSTLSSRQVLILSTKLWAASSAG